MAVPGGDRGPVSDSSRPGLRGITPAEQGAVGEAGCQEPQETWGGNSTLGEWARWLLGSDTASQEEIGTEEDFEDRLLAEEALRMDAARNESLVRRWTRRYLTMKAKEDAERARKGLLEEERKRYVEEKMQIDLSVVERFKAPPAAASWTGTISQVAFLVLAMEGMDFEDVWDRFFYSAPSGTYSIYVHLAADSQAHVPLSQWGAVLIPQVENTWCALAGVEVALLSAALADPRNEQFIFISHNTVPLKNFDYVYRQLVEVSPQTSKFCFAEPAQHKLATTETIKNEVKRQCIFRDFWRGVNPRTLKHHQWVVLSKEHARIVVKRAADGLRLWRTSWEVAAPDLTIMGEGCSDESLPVTSLLYDIEKRGHSTGNTWADLTRLGVEQQCLTYVMWRHCFTDTVLENGAPITKELDIVRRHGQIRMLTDKDFNFFKSALKRELNGYPAVFETLELDYLWRLVHQGFMFARKFVKGIRVVVKGRALPLARVLPAMWDRVEQQEAAKKVWSRLSTEGVPRSI